MTKHQETGVSLFPQKLLPLMSNPGVIAPVHVGTDEMDASSESVHVEGKMEISGSEGFSWSMLMLKLLEILS